MANDERFEALVYFPADGCRDTQKSAPVEGCGMVIRVEENETCGGDWERGRFPAARRASDDHHRRGHRCLVVV